VWKALLVQNIAENWNQRRGDSAIDRSINSGQQVSAVLTPKKKLKRKSSSKERTLTLTQICVHILGYVSQSLELQVDLHVHTSQVQPSDTYTKKKCTKQKSRKKRFWLHLRIQRVHTFATVCEFSSVSVRPTNRFPSPSTHNFPPNRIRLQIGRVSC